MTDSADSYWRGRFLRFVDPSCGVPDPDGLQRSDLSYTEAYNQIAAEDLSIDSLVANVAEAYQDRLEKELYGAWRAGYDYLHIYDEGGLSTAPLEREPLDSVTFSQYALPSNSKRPIRPLDIRHTHTYDLTSVPDHVLRAAWRGELDDWEKVESP